MKFLITGGQGFIGSYIANKLKQEGHKIDILDNYNTDYIGFCKIYREESQTVENINYIENIHRNNAFLYRNELIKDIPIISKWGYELEKWEGKKPDYIINCGNLSEEKLAKQYNRFTFDSIVSSIKKLKKIFKKVPIIHFSSSSLYSFCKEDITEDQPTFPINWHRTCKLMAETIINLERDIVLRPTKIYGYGDGKTPITMERDNILYIEESNHLYIKDLVEMILSIITNYQPGIYNLGSNYIVNSKILNNKIQEILGLQIEIKGKVKENLNSDKFMKTFNIKKLKYKNYSNTISDYFQEFLKHKKCLL